MSVGKAVAPRPSATRGLRRLSFPHDDDLARVKNLRVLDRGQRSLIDDLELTGFESIVKIRREKPLGFAEILRHPSLMRFCIDRKSTRLNSSHRCISYAVFCLKKKS